MSEPYIHPTAIVEDNVSLGEGVRVWHFGHVRENAKLAENVTLGKGVFVDSGVEIGANSRVQNGVSLYLGVEVNPFVFIGPHACFTNDLRPRAGMKKWDLARTQLGTGCSIGAGAVIVSGVRIGRFAMVAAGAIVTSDVPDFTLAVGQPARVHSQICACGKTNIQKPKMREDYILDCCHERLQPELIKVAEDVLSKIIC